MDMHIGCKFYRFNNDDIEIIRICRFKNATTFTAKSSDGSTFKISKEELESKYTKLNPDAYISISVVGLENGIKDVVLTLHRKEEIKSGDPTPYVICRQNILDFFTNQIYMKENINYVGMSISRETCPPDIDFKNCAICNNIESTQMIDVYIDDKFDDIYSLIKTEKADEVLLNMYNKSMESPAGFYGFTKNLKDLMISTRFMYDFLRSFNIYPLNFKVTIEDNNILPVQQVEAIEDIIKYKISAIFVTPYTKYIDLSKIEKNYILVSDINQDLYIVAYIKGDYINRTYDSLTDHNETDMLVKMIKNRHV